jgi:hypothetical protein
MCSLFPWQHEIFYLFNFFTLEFSQEISKFQNSEFEVHQSYLFRLSRAVAVVRRKLCHAYTASPLRARKPKFWLPESFRPTFTQIFLIPLQIPTKKG